MNRWLSGPFALVVPLFVVASCGAGTGPSVYKGGLPQDAIASYKAPTCVAKDGAKQDGPNATYYLTRQRGSLVLLELNDFGQGLSFKNSFEDENGYNFIVQLKENGKPTDAIHFVFPMSATQNAARYVFPAGTYKPVKSKARKIDGEPSLTCELVNQRGAEATPKTPAASSATPPAASSAAPPAGRVCIPGQTQECVGPGACRGGQVCVPDGTAFGPCDCGTGTPPAPAASSAAPPGKQR